MTEKKEKYYLKAIHNLMKKCNFYELALRLEEGQITEEEYNKEIDENEDAYVLDQSQEIEDYNDILVINEIVKQIDSKVSGELSVDDVGDLFSLTQEEIEKAANNFDPSANVNKI